MWSVSVQNGVWHTLLEGGRWLECLQPPHPQQWWEKVFPAVAAVTAGPTNEPWTHHGLCCCTCGMQRCWDCRIVHQSYGDLESLCEMNKNLILSLVNRSRAIKFNSVTYPGAARLRSICARWKAGCWGLRLRTQAWDWGSTAWDLH